MYGKLNWSLPYTIVRKLERRVFWDTWCLGSGGQVLLPQQVLIWLGRQVEDVKCHLQEKYIWWWNEVQECIQPKRLAQKKWDTESRHDYREMQYKVKAEMAKAKK